LTGSREHQRENCAYCGEFNVVGDLKFNQNGAPQAYQLVIEISRNTGICRSSFGQIISQSFQSHPPRGKQIIYLVANVFSGSAET